jgi:hypothetical protein
MSMSRGFGAQIRTPEDQLEDNEDRKAQGDMSEEEGAVKDGCTAQTY